MKSKVCGIREQYISALFTEGQSKVAALKKKKKRAKRDVKHRRANKSNPNTH